MPLICVSFDASKDTFKGWFRIPKLEAILKRLDTMFIDSPAALISGRYLADISDLHIGSPDASPISIRAHHFLGKSSGSSCPLRYRRTFGHQFRALSFHSHFDFNFVHQPFCSAPFASFSFSFASPFASSLSLCSHQFEQAALWFA